MTLKEMSVQFNFRDRYLVLARPNLGVVISSTARFYTSIKLLPCEPEKCQGCTSIIVESPQFKQISEFAFDIKKRRISGFGTVDNVFIERCLKVVFAFAKEHLGADRFDSIMSNASRNSQAINIKLRADNDFYSQIKRLKNDGLPLLSRSLEALPRFIPCPLKADGSYEIAKTGMGSSAALTISLVGALLSWFEIIDLGRDVGSGLENESRMLVHNLGQIVHAVAQEKCGSGFDISAAVYGTQMYVRFNTDPMQACMEPDATSKVIYQTAISREMWDQTIVPLCLPPGINIMLGDICGGSSSISMAKRVMKWLKDKPMASASVWAALAEVIIEKLCFFCHL